MNPKLKKAFRRLRTIISCAALLSSMAYWGLQGWAKYHYGAPEGYDDPAKGKSCISVTQMADWAASCKDMDNYPLASTRQVYQEPISVREHLNDYKGYVAEQGYDWKMTPFNVYFSSQINDSGQTAEYYRAKGYHHKDKLEYKMTLDMAVMDELQNFTDSVTAACMPGTQSGLYIYPEFDKTGQLNSGYEQAYYAAFDQYSADQERADHPFKTVFDEAKIRLSIGLLANASVSEVKWIIGHELGHKFYRLYKLGEAETKPALKLSKNDSIWAQVKEEKWADSFALEITRNPDAMISFSGRDNQFRQGPKTSIGRWLEYKDNQENPSDHPLNIERARYADVWKKKHATPARHWWTSFTF